MSLLSSAWGEEEVSLQHRKAHAHCLVSTRWYYRNKLTAFPDSLAQLPRLERLHASQNEITQLPHNIGALATLRDLRLDWNRIKQLPFSFRLLAQLETLRMEQNPLRLPPIEYVLKGVAATMAFIERSLDEFIRNARRKIVERLQEILHFAATLVPHELDPASSSDSGSATRLSDDDRRTILSLFEPNCERVAPTGDEKLAFFAVVWDEFYTALLPALERTRAQRDPTFVSFHFETFARDEVDDALRHYSDDFGAVSTRDTAAFRKCACIDALEWRQHGVRKRKVCIPGQAPYRCQRDALLVRMQMMTHEEAKDQLASTYLKTKIARLVAKTKRKCVAFINSDDGVAHFEALAHALAKRLCQKRKRLKKLRRTHERETQAFTKKKQKLQARIDAFRRVRDARLADVRAKLEKLEQDKSKLERDGESSGKRDSKRLEKLASKIAKLEAELVQEPVEDKKVLELEIALEALETAELRATAVVEKARAKEMQSDDEEDESSASESDASASGSERDASASDSSSGDDDDDDDESSTRDDDEQAALQTDARAEPPGGTKFFQIDMPALAFVDYRRAATRAIERELGDDRDVNEEELVVLYQTHIRDAYVADKCERVAQRATYEFLQMRAVLKRWMGLGNRAVFEAWRDLMRANREDAANVREKAARKQVVEQQNRELEEELARLEARKWVQRTDMYTDAVYYEHSVTGETSWYAPTYWDDEQAKQLALAAKHKVPQLKLPPI